MKKQILFLISICLLFSCSNDDKSNSKIIAMRINHHQDAGMAVGPVLTLLTQQGTDIGTNKWDKFYSEIVNFNYVPGKIYNLSVLVEKVTPPADGSSLKYTLLEIKSEEEIAYETPFEIALKTNGQSFVTSDFGLKLLNQIEIDCNNLCNELETNLQSQNSLTGTFERVSTNKIKLIKLSK